LNNKTLHNKLNNKSKVWSLDYKLDTLGVSTFNIVKRTKMKYCTLHVAHTLEQSAPTRHVRTFHFCFSESSEGFSFQAFIPMTFTATFVVPVQWHCHFRTL